MKINGKEINIKYLLYTQGLPLLIIVDLLLITVSLIFQIPQDISTKIQYFDLIVCIILLIEYFINLYLSSPKKDYILDSDNLIGLIASIPFDFILVMILPITVPVSFLRYLRILKLIRVVNLAKFRFITELFKKTGFHKVLIGIFIIIVTFWAVFYLFSTTYNWFDDLYFVIVTLTTVGYGDITPKTYNEKVLSMILILIGIFVFSTITATISSYLTDRILEDDEEDIKYEIRDAINTQSENILNELETVREENKRLHDEIEELKELIKDK